MEIFPLSEGCFTIDQTKKFIPFDKEKDDLQKRPFGSLLVEIQPFVVVTSRDIILLDGGLGFSAASGKLQLYQNLISIGIDPSTVTKVLLSHLHKDHSGGIAIVEKNSALRTPSFPHAIYYVNKQELELGNTIVSPSYIRENFEWMNTAKNVVQIEGEGVIDEYISYKMTGAHSPFHQVFWIEENNHNIFFCADEAPQLQQMKSKFVAKYDYDGKKAMEYRKDWWQCGEEGHWTFLFYHDIKTPVKVF